MKGTKILKATEQCLMTVPKMKVKVIENILAIISELNDVIWGGNMRCEKGDGKLLLRFRGDFLLRSQERQENNKVSKRRKLCTVGKARCYALW